MTTLAFQQLCEHICLSKLISSSCFTGGKPAWRPNGAKQQEEINFDKKCARKVVEKHVLSSWTGQNAYKFPENESFQ